MSDLAGLAEAVAVDPLVGHPADYHVFHKFLARCKQLPAITTAVCWPLSDVALRGTVEAGLASRSRVHSAGSRALRVSRGSPDSVEYS